MTMATASRAMMMLYMSNELSGSRSCWTRHMSHVTRHTSHVTHLHLNQPLCDCKVPQRVQKHQKQEKRSLTRIRRLKVKRQQQRLQQNTCATVKAASCHNPYSLPSPLLLCMPVRVTIATAHSVPPVAGCTRLSLHTAPQNNEYFFMQAGSYGRPSNTSGAHFDSGSDSPVSMLSSTRTLPVTNMQSAGTC
jgi:hypothetical protein